MAAILIVEDKRDNRELLANVVTILGYDIATAESGEEALGILEQRNDVLLVLCDIRLPGMDGIEFGTVAQQCHPFLKVAFMTGDESAVDEAIANSILTRVIVNALGKGSTTS